jgi:hypothetical protein
LLGRKITALTINHGAHSKHQAKTQKVNIMNEFTKVVYNAINKKHSPIARRLIEWEIKTQVAVDDETFKREEFCYDKVCMLRDELPKREVVAVEKHLKALRGY